MTPPSRYTQEFVQGARLGKGGFGMVYRARHILDGVEYAVKKVRVAGSFREQERAVREATCLAKLDHPNVIRYYQVWKEEVADSSSLSDFFDSSGDEFQSESATDISSAPRRIPGQHHSRSSGTHSAGVGRRARGQSVLHIQMQLAEFTLRTWLQSVGRSTSLEANRPYFVQILLGLEHIHKNSLIHRDLTPANVFIANKIIKIGDFGLSREMVSGDLPPGASLLPLCAPENKGTVSPRRQRGEWRENARSVTRGVGTTLYMSPEQRAGQPYDFKVDIYSLGVILLEMCHPVSTAMERVHVLSNLQRHILPRETQDAAWAEVVCSMTDECPKNRPAVDELLASSLFAAAGDICVSAKRGQMHALMHPIYEQIDSVQRVRSFTVQGGVTDDMVFLQYFVDAVFGELNSKGGSMPDYQSGEGVLSLSSSGAVADHGIREARHRQALIRLSSAIMEMPGVVSVTGSGV